MSAFHLAKFRLDDARRRPFSAQEDTRDDLESALLALFNQVGHEFDTGDPSDDGFVDYAGDQMSDAGVPVDLIDDMQAWLRRGAPRRGRRR